MYGLVNQGIKDLVINAFGEEKWNQLCEEAKSPTDFVSMQYYDDQLTYRLVGAASAMLNVPAESILSKFGQHWVEYTAREGYGPIMDLFGADFKSCLMNLNNLHTRMGMSLPHLKPPSFKFQEISPTEYQIEYISERKGLNAMVVGLFEGLAKKYKVNVKVNPVVDHENSNRNLFQIIILEAS